MAGRREYRKIDIDVEPFLSIMAIVLKLISLILVVIVMRIAINPKKAKIVALEGLWEGSKNNAGVNPKEPRYLDCFEDKVVIYPHAIKVTWEDLHRPGNAVEQTFAEIQKNYSNEYVVIMARPRSVKFFRLIRRMVSEKANVEFGMDVVDANYVVNWDEALKGLSVTLEDEPTNKPPAEAHQE